MRVPGAGRRRVQRSPQVRKQALRCSARVVGSGRGADRCTAAGWRARSSGVIASSIRASSGASAAGSAARQGAGFAFSDGWLVCANVGDESSTAMHDRGAGNSKSSLDIQLHLAVEDV